jgi:hypothetical protein
MPAFWVDRREVTAQALLEFRMKKYGAGWEAAKKRYTGLDPGPGPEPKILGIDWIAELESQGKRMPSAAELYYLSRVVCPSPSNPGDKELVDSCVLKDGSTIDGLHSGLLEWTSTKTGGPFTGYSPLNPNDKWFGLLRAVGGGSPVPGRTSHTGFQSIPLPSSKNITVRGVRSTHPRRRPEDFATQVKSQEL